MKVYVKSPPKLSRAMFRVANALERYAPPGIEVVQNIDDADLFVAHVIGLEANEYRTHQPCAVLQYCTGGGADRSAWFPLWDRAVAVWSYYDLFDWVPFDKFYHAPLGIDPVFRVPYVEVKRDYKVLTSGYVNGHGQEAIEEPTLAAYAVDGFPVHLGPMPTGLSAPLEMNLVHEIGDSELASVYRRTTYVAGLRFVEGFEMGVVEGLACGARPIVFDRPDNRFWFGDHALYVPEWNGDQLTQRLAHILSKDPEPVTREERATVLKKFNWSTLVADFWNLVTERMKETA